MEEEMDLLKELYLPERGPVDAVLGLGARPELDLLHGHHPPAGGLLVQGLGAQYRINNSRNRIQNLRHNS